MEDNLRSILVCGAGGFIGGHLVKRLKAECPEAKVVGADLKPNPYLGGCDEFFTGDLRSQEFIEEVFSEEYSEIYQLAADMGGAGFVFTGDNDADILSNSALINLNILQKIGRDFKGELFYSSSACMYPEYNQLDPATPNCREDSAYPAAPDSEYGWEKLFSERLYLSYARNYGLSVRIGRFHNIFGPYGSWNDGREKAPAALCRKIASVEDGGQIEIWGDGMQTRSFLYVDECVEGVIRLMKSDCSVPLNIGSDEMISINGLVDLICEIAQKNVTIKYIDGPEGVRGRNSHNDLIYEKLNWRPVRPLREGLSATYDWIRCQIAEK